MDVEEAELREYDSRITRLALKLSRLESMVSKMELPKEEEKIVLPRRGEMSLEQMLDTINEISLNLKELRKDQYEMEYEISQILRKL